ncbi:hypothetical protein [Dongia deserti]|uniref:hypothetical protein n=1 Tax=Dongia deserti TaxID=2268030 RepID=UPI000E65112F|nr:hypothetical protein [Dongia deserti]
MSTGNFENWHGTMTDIGPLYPFVGSEMFLFIVGLVFWIGWHVLQWRMEASNYSDDLEILRSPDKMDRALKGEHVLRTM